jgi:crotonobetainyl-CoA:carnitine CoA-transferase CaiB-like acyl-CoA transferase
MTRIRSREFATGARCPLDGVRILDLSRVIAGNMVSLALADFGAEVIKIESPEGDALRDWLVNGIAANWKVYARNKKSVGLNLRKPEGRELLLRLVESAQVFIENFRPGTLEKMGLGPEVLHARNPRLVILRASGWGQTGPFRHKPGFGTLIEGMSGFAAMNGFPDREPVLPPTQMADMYAGYIGSMAVMVALREIEVNGGAGQVIDLPLFDPMFMAMGPQAASYQASGKVRPRSGSRSTTAAPRNTYRTRDERWVSMSASTQKMAERLFRAIGRADLIDNPRYRTNADRVRNATELDAIVGEFIGSMTLVQALEFFDRAEVTVGPVYDISQLIDEPYIAEREILANYPDAQTGEIAMHCVVPRLSATPGAIRKAAPVLVGEDNAEVLGALGLDAAELDGLAAQDIIYRGPQRNRSSGEE